MLLSARNSLSMWYISGRKLIQQSSTGSWLWLPYDLYYYIWDISVRSWCGSGSWTTGHDFLMIWNIFIRKLLHQSSKGSSSGFPQELSQLCCTKYLNGSWGVFPNDFIYFNKEVDVMIDGPEGNLSKVFRWLLARIALWFHALSLLRKGMEQCFSGSRLGFPHDLIPCHKVSLG